MSAPRTVGRSIGRVGATWRRRRAQVLAASDLCVWCGHAGARAVNHHIPLARAPEMGNDPNNLEPIHGVERCPTCNRVCNTELGSRILGVDVYPPTRASREW